MSPRPLQVWIREGGEARHLGTGRTVPLVHSGLLRDLPEDAMPARPRGDHKEKTFNLLIRDGVDPRLQRKERELIGTAAGASDGAMATDGHVPAGLQSAFGEILDDHYVIEGQSARFLFPIHVDLPAIYEFHGRYKMFNGKILAFLSQPSLSTAQFNTSLIDRFYGLFNEAADLTLLDRELVRLARETAETPDFFRASADTLIERHYPDSRPPGAILPDVHTRFQQDLETVLAIPRLNRGDRVTAAINVFYLHLGLYFQRLGWLLEEELSEALRPHSARTGRESGSTADTKRGWYDASFAGSIRIRVADGQFKSLSLKEGAVTSYAEQNRRQLLLPANLSLLAAARQVLMAAGAPAQTWTFTGIEQECADNPPWRVALEEGLNLMAEATVETLSEVDRDDVMRQIARGGAALNNFREAILKVGRGSLRRHGRDILHFLVLRGGRGYISRRGRNIFYFELGQDLLLLLSKLIVQDRAMPLRAYLEELRAYGFEPQSREEEGRLVEALHALNLLDRHSDAGEATYVKHFL